MEDVRRPIAVFDSGVGGISVLRALIELMPHENYIYFGDSLRAPYGSKSLQEVRELTERHVTGLLQQGAKAVVVACNTATSADISILREHYPAIPMIGIEPAIKPAVLFKKHPKVLVLGTPMTIHQEKFQCLLKEYVQEADIDTLPCPGLVEYIERGELYGRVLENFLAHLLSDYLDKQIDAVVLGCTHYPFVADSIGKLLGPQVMFFEGGPGTARETKRRLQQKNLLNTFEEAGVIRFENSENTPEKMRLCQLLLHAGRSKSKENVNCFERKI